MSLKVIKNNNSFWISIVVALDFPLFIKKEDPVRWLNEILEGLDYTRLLAPYSHKGRKPSVPPIILFKILMFAEMYRSYSSRDIESLCRYDVRFMVVTPRLPAPCS